MQFLSDQWFDALEDALARAGEPEGGERCAIGQLVTGAPGGDVAYTLVAGAGPAALVRDSIAPAEVVLVEDYETARAIASGVAPSDALAAGRVKVRGDVQALLRAQGFLAALVEAGAELRARTVF